jgi:hypothetical protein
MLVNYSSSSSDSEEAPPQQLPQKRKKLPVPFEKVKAVKLEDHLNHDGRKRQIEHMEGNWASHIFIEPEKEIISKFGDFLSDIQENFNEIIAVQEPHVSLSKMFILKHHWIDNFFNILTKTVKFDEFHLEFSNELRFLSNEDSTRHFACLLVDNSCLEVLRKTVDLIDKTLKEFELPCYYEDSIFHMSILWKLTEFSDEEKKTIEDGVKSVMSGDVNFYSLVDKIIFKTGNKIRFLNCS